MSVIPNQQGICFTRYANRPALVGKKLSAIRATLNGCIPNRNPNAEAATESNENTSKRNDSILLGAYSGNSSPFSDKSSINLSGGYTGIGALL